MLWKDYQDGDVWTRCFRFFIVVLNKSYWLFIVIRFTYELGVRVTHRVFIALFVEYLLCFFYVIIICIYTSWKNVVWPIWKTVFLLHVLDLNAIFAHQDPLPSLRQGTFYPHTKIPRSAPAWAVVHKCPICASSRRQGEWTPVQVSYLYHKWSSKVNFVLYI